MTGHKLDSARIHRMERRRPGSAAVKAREVQHLIEHLERLERWADSEEAWPMIGSFCIGSRLGDAKSDLAGWLIALQRVEGEGK